MDLLQHAFYEKQFLSSVLKNTDDAIIGCTPGGDIVSWNPGAEAVFGYTEAETLGRSISFLLQDYTAQTEHISYAINEKCRFETVLEKKDKSLVPVSITICPVWNDDKVINGMVLMAHDLTAQKKTESDIFRQNLETKEILEKSVKEVSDYKYALDESSIVAITDQKGIIRHANDNFCKISKYSREELIGQDHRIINSGYHSAEFIRNLWVTIANGNIWKGEIKNKAKDGTIYWVDTTIVPFLNEHGKPYQYVAIRADITERKRAEENLEKIIKELTGYKYALDESSIIAVTDQKGIILHANDNFCKISKYSREELIGQDHSLINSGYHSDEFIRRLWVTIANGKVWKGELKNKAKDGTIYWVDTTIVPFLDHHGKPYQYLAIRADITERKKAEEEIFTLNEDLEKRVHQRTEELEAFSYSVSHDLRAPLRAVNGYAQILKEDYCNTLDSEGNRLIDTIQNNARRMGTLIDDLLAFSRLGRKEVNLSFIDMTEFVNSVAGELGKTIEHHANIRVHPLHPVFGDAALIEHVINNLLSNAIKYSSNAEDPLVEISSEQKDKEIIFAIKDNGVGFNMQYYKKLFGVFQRLHSSEEFEGTGVGLAIVHRIIQKHNGRTWAESKPGEGATFYFSLPDIKPDK